MRPLPPHGRRHRAPRLPSPLTVGVVLTLGFHLLIWLQGPFL